MTLTTRTNFTEAVGPHVSFSFGRMNPPHYGHEGLIKTLQTVAKSGSWALFLSKTHEPKKNPLTYQQKLDWIKALYPQVQGHLVEDPNIKTFLQAAAYLYDKGFRSATFVAGEDDMPQMRKVLEDYNGKQVEHGFYNFNPLTFMESPRLTSATNAREAAKSGDAEAFERATRVPPNILVNGKTLFQTVRLGMSLPEDPRENERFSESIISESIITESLSVEQLAHISDKALDDAYHYGLSTPGNNFGWLANIESATAAKRMIDSGITDIDAIASAIHDGWNKTAMSDYMGKLQLDTPTIPDKKKKRYALAQQTYAQLPEVEKEKDRVVARAMLKAMGIVSESNITELYNEPKPERDDNGRPEFMEWEDFITAVANLVKSNFDIKKGFKNKKLEKTQAVVKFIPYDPYEFGPVTLYAYKDRRPPHRIGVRAHMQVGTYSQFKGQLLTQYKIPQNNLREVFMTPANATMIAHAIMKNTDGALKQENITEAPGIEGEWGNEPESDADPYHEGFLEGLKSKTNGMNIRAQNPYETGSKAAKLWNRGFDAAQFEEHDIKEPYGYYGSTHGTNLDLRGLPTYPVKEAAEKSTKAVAKYQDMPHDGQRCDHCTMWRPPHGCSAVKGNIAANGWCSFYKRSHRKDLDETESLDEAASPVLFHYTGSVGAALNILKNNEFMLSISTGNVEAQYAPKGYNYFLSTTRSKVGGYHEFTGSTAVMFNLDGNWFNRRYPVKAIDYWAGFDKQKHSESEDRIFSREPTIPADAITAVHVLLKEKGEYASPTTRQLMIVAKKRGLPTYLYTNENAWKLQDTKRAISVSNAQELLRGQKKTGYVSTFDGKKYLEPWLELLFKKKRSELSKKANELRYSLTYWNGGQFADDLGLRNEIANARKPGNSGYETATKIIAAMNKIGAKDVKDLLTFLHKKWDAEALQKEDIEEHEGSIIGTVGGGNDYPDRQVATFPWDRWVQPDTGNSKLDYVDDLDEVNMSPSSLAKFAATPEAQAMTMGFEAEMLVPGLQDEDGYDDYAGVSRAQYEFRRDPNNWDLTRDAPFPTSKDWANQVVAWASQGDMLDAEDIGNIRVELRDINQNFFRYVVNNKNVSTEIVKPENLKWIVNNIDKNFAWDLTKKEIKQEILDNLDDDYEFSIAGTARKLYIEKMLEDSNPQDYEKLWKAYLKNKKIKNISDWFMKWGQPENDYVFYPYLKGTPPQDPTEITTKELAASWKAVIGAKVKYGSGYHGVKRDATSWILEPDSSIKGVDEGIELISPPMPFQQGMAALDKFFQWASEGGYYGNESTGFHVGVSLPEELQSKIDPLKVIMLLGDQYVLDLFDRGSNEYTKSSLGGVQKLLKSRSSNVKAADYAKKLRNDLATTARAIVNRTMGNGRYVSVNIKSNYIEFRSMGGNFMEHIQDIKNTVLRYVQVMAIAADPRAYREEYAKKLYKLIAKNIPQDDDQLSNFAMYASGLIDQNELKMRLQKRQVDKAQAAADAKTKIYRVWMGDPPYGSNLSDPKRFATPSEAYAWAKSYADRVSNYYSAKDLYVEPDDHSLPPQILSKPASGGWLQ